MLVLDWPSRKAIGRARELSGQVIAAALVADAPKVLCPNAPRFAGTEWDATRRVLTIRAHAKRAIRASWEVLWPRPPVEVEGPPGAKHRFSNGRLTLGAACRGRIEWRLRYG
jgi:hypothetical protein